MKKFYIIANELKDKNFIMRDRIVNLLKEHQASYRVNSLCGSKDGKKEHYTCIHDIDEDTDCIIVIGGDGTMLQASRDLAALDVPMIGVNLGHLGFLAEIEKDQIEEMIQMLLEDRYKIQSRMMLRGDVYRRGEKLFSDIALNDIVCARSGAIRVIDLKVYVNHEYLKMYSADGVIISTPTGSTAYNLSAGGPILEPGANIIVITPICCHTIGARSIVLSADSDICIEVCEDRHVEEEGSGVYFDGKLYSLLPGDVIHISKSDLHTKIMKLNSKSFVEIMHQKMK